MENTANKAMEVADWIIRQRKGTLSDTEQQALQQWLTADPAHRALFEEMVDESNLLSAIRDLEGIDPEPAIQRVMYRLKLDEMPPVQPMRLTYTRFFRYAAAAAILVLIGIGSYRYFQKPPVPVIVEKSAPVVNDVAPGGQKAILTLGDNSTIILDNASNGELGQQGNVRIIKLSNGQLRYELIEKGPHSKEVSFNTMTTPRGGQYQLTLPDGTKVWLNAASSITYPTEFTGDQRAVRITGEVYFEVVSNSRKPFKVAVNNAAHIEVLGTSFNVNAYSDEPATRTTLLEGAVRVVAGTQSIKLTPGQQAQIAGAQNIRTIQVTNDADIEQVMAWKNGGFSFKDANLREVMREVSRWYDVDVVYEKGSEKSDRYFSGGIERSLNLSLVLRVLEKSKVRFRIEGKKLIVMP